jgi:chaperonin GroEL
MGADLIKEAASRTNDTAGDGTTTATVLTHAMVKEGLKLLTAGYDAKELKTGVEFMTSLVVKTLRAMAKKVETQEEIAQVGTISANGDKEIGKLIAEAMQKVGRDGIITVEDAKGMTTTLEVVDGMQFERGYLSPYFVTNPEKMNAIYENACVLITDKKLSNLQEIVPVLEQVSQAQRPLLIIADDVDGQALQLLIVNKLKGGLPVVAIKAPGHGHVRDAVLQDIATLAGSTLVSSASGVGFKDLRVQMLGNLKKVVVDAKSSTLVSDGKTQANVEARVSELKTQLTDVALTSEEKDIIRMRVAKLSSGVAVIKVGGATELETTEKKYRIEDALNATRAAVEEGIVPGGGMALLGALDRVKLHEEAQGPGQDIVLKACEAPIRQIVANAGGSPDVILSKIHGDQYPHGFNAATGEFGDLLAAGIIDPVKVTRTALENASSVAITFFSLDAVVVDEEEKK